MRRFRLLAALLALGCAPASTVGQSGVGELAFADAFRFCAEDCSLDVPIAVDASAWVRIVNSEELAGATLRSLDPEVVGARSTASGEVFRLDAHRAGDAELDLLDASGSVVDRFVVAVRDPARLAFVGAEPVSPVRLTTRPRSFSFATVDAEGRRLRGVGAPRFESTSNIDLDVVSVGDFEERVVTPLFGGIGRVVDQVAVAGDQSGSRGELRVVLAGGAPTVIAFDVVAPVVTSITVEHRVEENVAHVWADIEVEEPAPGLLACCEWRVEPADAPVALNAPECDTVRAVSMTPDVAQEVVIVCASGGVEGSTPISLETSTG